MRPTGRPACTGNRGDPDRLERLSDVDALTDVLVLRFG